MVFYKSNPRRIQYSVVLLSGNFSDNFMALAIKENYFLTKSKPSVSYLEKDTRDINGIYERPGSNLGQRYQTWEFISGEKITQKQSLCWNEVAWPGTSNQRGLFKHIIAMLLNKMT